MRDLGRAARFVAGAVGDPGDRTFLVEVHATGAAQWFVLEKRQVAALALESAQLLESSGFAEAGAGEAAEAIGFPDEISFRVGQIELRYREDTGVVTVVLLPVNDEDEPVQFEVTPAQLDRMARGAADAVQAGRPACPRCGLAMDAEGHSCPVDNGDLRAHRP